MGWICNNDLYAIVRESMIITTRPILFLAFANNRDDRARYLRNLAEEA